MYIPYALRKGRAKRVLIAMLALLLAFMFGVSSKLVDIVVERIDPPKLGYHHVSTIFDGDTIEVILEGRREKVRFIGLDTPETHHPDKGVQCFGFAAKNQLENLIGSNDVRLEADPTNSNRDRYDRLLRYVYLEDGTLLNQTMIESGFGFAYTAFPFEKKDDFVMSQQIARDGNAGLWSSCDVTIRDDIFFNTGPDSDGDASPY